MFYLELINLIELRILADEPETNIECYETLNDNMRKR
ncbi:hypothetical protein D046_9290, partial [Vibrio parahaemolyticus V-223/04]